MSKRSASALHQAPAAPRELAAAASGFRIFYDGEANTARWLDDPHVMAVIGFGAHTGIDPRDPRKLSIALPPLAEPRLVEIWQAEAPGARDHDGDLHYAIHGEVVFGHTLIDETGKDGLAAVAQQAYARMLQLLDRLGYPHLLRLWNYFPEINLEDRGLERYRAFCVGRHEAFRAHGFQEKHLAAASAVGTVAPGCLLYFIACREAGTPVENPRQVSAYHYPDCYAPKTPLFSRALLKSWPRATHLYISGTASIVGHRTCHAGDALEQFRETARNLDATIAAANRLRPLGASSLAQLSHVKVYLRRPEDFAAVAADLDRVLGKTLPRICLRADICRSDLLLEIDAFYAEPA